jgi:ActR/RegA family two-component response regulator
VVIIREYNGNGKAEYMHPYRILIVDDNPAFVKPLGRYLETAGYDIETTASGQGAASRPVFCFM